MNKLYTSCRLTGLQEGTRLHELTEHLAQKMKPFRCKTFVKNSMHTGRSTQRQTQLQSRDVQPQARRALRKE